MISLPTYNQGEVTVDELYITSEHYPVLVQDEMNITAQDPDSNNSYMLARNLETFDLSPTIQGSHSLDVIRVDHTVYDTDTFEFTTIEISGNHTLEVVPDESVEHTVYDTDIFDLTPSISGNHSLDVIRIDHEVYDTDAIDLTPSLQGNHTLS